jgi:hypothetical protein
VSVRDEDDIDVGFSKRDRVQFTDRGVHKVLALPAEGMTDEEDLSRYKNREDTEVSDLAAVRVTEGEAGRTSVRRFGSREMRSLNLTEMPISSLTSHMPACQISFGDGMPAVVGSKVIRCGERQEGFGQRSAGVCHGVSRVRPIFRYRLGSGHDDLECTRVKEEKD